jgi:hypothetical protein
VDELWVCPRCRSLNLRGGSQCYSCQLARRAQAPAPALGHLERVVPRPPAVAHVFVPPEEPAQAELPIAAGDQAEAVGGGVGTPAKGDREGVVEALPVGAINRAALERLMDPAAVTANRNGRLAPDQVASLSGRSRRRRIVGWAVALLGAVLLVSSWALAGPDVRVQAFALSVVVVVFAGFWLWSDPLGGDVRAGRVESVVGVIQKETEAAGWSRNRSRRCIVIVGDQVFPIDRRMWAALEDGEPVRAYYLPRSLTLLSFEPLEP